MSDDYPQHVARVEGITFPPHVHREYPKWVRRDGVEVLVGSADEEHAFLGEGLLAAS